MGRDKGPHADLVYVQWAEEAAGHKIIGVMEFQTKLFTTSVFTVADLRDETQKICAHETVPVVLCIVYTHFGPDLESVLNGQRVLVLGSWGDEAAVYCLAPDKKLYWGRVGGKWSEWPTKTIAEPQLNCGNAAVVSVRRNLELVLPHPEVVRVVLGRDLLAKIMAAAEGRTPDSVSAMFGSVSTFLERQAVNETRPVARVVDKFRGLSDAVRIEEAMKMVAEERGFTEQQHELVVSVLNEKWIRTVGDLRVLSQACIEARGLSPVVKGYLLRIHSGRDA